MVRFLYGLIASVLTFSQQHQGVTKQKQCLAKAAEVDLMFHATLFYEELFYISQVWSDVPFHFSLSLVEHRTSTENPSLW